MTKNSTPPAIINLDANASVPPLRDAKLALLAALDLQGNASSPHALGRRLRKVMDASREFVAKALLGQDKELFFCSGASEGNRWVVDAVALTAKSRGTPFRTLVSPFEHPSLMKCLIEKAESGAIELQIIEIVDGKLVLDAGMLACAEVVFVTAAHNETGYLPDLCAIGSLISKDAIFISDAAQAVARLEELPRRVDVIVASSHKMGGVVGAGAVLVRGQGRGLSAPWKGGGQEAGLRPGSESVPLIAAMGEAAKNIEQTRQLNFELAQMRDAIEADLLKEWPFAFVVGNHEKRLSQTLAICLNGLDPEGLRIAVDQAGICVGFGSACSALAPEPSPALLAFGLTPAQARATIRISLSPETEAAMVALGVDRLKHVVKSLLPMKSSN